MPADVRGRGSSAASAGVARTRSVQIEATVAAVATAIVYLLTLAGNHSETEDTVPFAVRLRDNPHSDAPHLIYDWFSWSAYHLARSLGITDDPLRPAQVKNALFGAAAVGLLWLVVRRAGQTRLVAATASGILAFSYGFWWNNVEGDVYAISAFAALICLALAYRAVGQPTVGSFALLGVANGAAVLAHLTNVFFAAVAAVALVLAWRAGRVRSWWKPGAAYALAASAVVIPAYAAAAAILHLGSLHAFRSWFAITTGSGKFGHANPAMFGKGAAGAARALVGGHSTLSFHFVRNFINAHFPDRPLREEYYFLRGYDHALAVFLLALTFLVALLIAVLAASWLRRPALNPGGKTLGVLSLAWLVAYLPILLYWDPFNIELWYVAWIPASVLLALPLADAERLFPRRLALPFAALAVGSLLVVNLFGSVWPQHDRARDYWAVRAEWYRTHAEAADVVLASGYIETGYLSYLTRARVVDVDRVFTTAPTVAAAVAEIGRRLHGPRPRRVYISDEVFHPFADTAAGCPRVDPTICAEARVLRGAFLARSKLIAEPELERVWELRSTGS